MNIIKRDGSEVQFDSSKIINAISKANEATIKNSGPAAGISKAAIEYIANEVVEYAESIPSTLNVEDIQDKIQQVLMKIGPMVATRYITYRYQRELVRKSNTTDEQVLNLLERNNEEAKQENSNKNPIINSTQRDYMAGEVSKDLTERILLPQDIVEAHKAGIIHFHDSDYFAQHMHNCDLVNLEDMLQNGTVISGVAITKPHSLRTASNVATQIVAQVASNQYGGQTISLAHLAPFVDISRQKYIEQVKAELEGVTDDADVISKVAEARLADEIKDAVQTIQYQLITLMTTNGQTPFVSVNMDLSEAKEGREREDLVLLIAEVLRQRIKGVPNDKGVFVTPAFPKLLYILDDYNDHEGSQYWDLTKLAAECTAKRMVPDYISAKVMRDYKMGDVYGCMGLVA